MELDSNFGSKLRAAPTKTQKNTCINLQIRAPTLFIRLNYLEKYGLTVYKCFFFFLKNTVFMANSTQRTKPFRTPDLTFSAKKSRLKRAGLAFSALKTTTEC
jgi:hypothetical protein